MLKTICVVISLMNIVAAPTAAETNTASTGRAQLERMATFIESQPHFSYTVHSGYDVVQKDGQKIEFLESRRIAISRPVHHLRADFVLHDGTEGILSYDGKQLGLYNKSEELHLTTATVGTMDEAINLLSTRMGVQMPMALLVSSKLTATLREKVQSVDVVGTSSVQSTPCIHLAARGKLVDLQVWVQEGAQPLPRRVVLTYKNEKGMPQYRADISDWALNAAHDPALFTVSVPPHVEKHEFKALPLHLNKSERSAPAQEKKI